MYGVLEEDLVVLTSDFRLVLQIILWPLIIVGVLGNIGVVWRITFAGINTSFKPFYRCSLFSLALSDLLLLGSSGTNILTMLNSQTLLWKLTKLSCTVIPYLQTVAVLVASLNLAGIALDRYTAIKSKYPLSNNGVGWFAAMIIITIIWTIAAGTSYPVLNLYNTEDIVIINNFTVYTGSLCISNRQTAAQVYTALFGVIFIPLAAIFILVHVLLAFSIYQRKSPGESTEIRNPPVSQDTSTTCTSVINDEATIAKKNKQPIPTHIIRKRRTVRVILMLIIVFGICRIPQWAFLLIKLHITISGDFSWYLHVILSTLTIFNAAVHPFLYTFLNDSLSLIAWINALCCIQNESMSIESSGVLKERVDQKDTPDGDGVDGGGGGTSNIKIPRGPYSA